MLRGEAGRLLTEPTKTDSLCGHTRVAEAAMRAYAGRSRADEKLGLVLEEHLGFLILEGSAPVIGLAVQG